MFGAYTVMTKLLLLAFIAVATEAMAPKDAQCVPERAAMVDTIRAYARFEAGVFVPLRLSHHWSKPLRRC
jgi:hypothetical protein